MKRAKNPAVSQGHDAQSSKPRKRRLARVRRFLRWSIRVLVLVVALLCFAVWLGVQRATDLTLWALREAALDDRVELSRVDVAWDRVRVEGVALKLGETPEALLELGTVELEFDPLAVGNRELQKLTIRNPRLRVSGKLEQLQQSAPNAVSGSSPPSPGPSSPRSADSGTFLKWLAEGWQLHEIALDPLPVTIALEGYPQVEARLAMRTGLLHLGGEALESDQLRELKIENLRIARAGDTRNPPFLGVESLRAVFSLKEVRQGRVYSLEVDRPSLHITPYSLPFLQVLRRLQAERQPLKPQPAGTAPARRALQVDDLVLTGGQGFLGGFPRELGIPQLSMQVTARTPEPPTRTRPGQHLHEFTLKDLRVGPPPGSGPRLISIPQATARTTLAQLLERRIQQLEIPAGAFMRINPDLMEFPGKYARLFGAKRAQPSGEPPAAGTAGAAPSAAGETPAPPARREFVHINELAIHDARFELSDLGTRVPHMQFTASLETTQFAWPADPTVPDAEQPPAHTQVHTLRARDFTAAPPFALSAPFLGILKLELDVTSAQLARKQILAARADGVNFAFDRTFRSFISATTPEALPVNAARPAPLGTPAQEKEPQPPWTVQDLAVDHARVSLANLGLGIPDHEFELEPIRLKEVNFAEESALLPAIPQRIELALMAIRSPYNPLVKVITAESLFCEFTFPGLLRKEIDKLTILHPTVRVGEDLFWYLDRFKKRGNAGPPPAAPVVAEVVQSTAAPAQAGRTVQLEPEPGWVIREFDLAHGKIIYAPSGLREVALPWTYTTTSQDLNFSNLAELQLNLNLVIPVEDYKFPDLKLELDGMGGEIGFNLPLGSDAKNLVNSLRVKSLRFRQYHMDDLWAALTFDERGAYINLGGTGYEGYMTGALNFLPFEGFAWNGWVAASSMDLGSLNQVLGKNVFTMAGRSTMRVVAEGRDKEITRVTGNFQALEPGQIELTWLDKVLERLPPDWDRFRTSLAKISIETFRQYRYEAGRADLDYSGGGGTLKMDFTGPDGARKVLVRVHPPGVVPPTPPRALKTAAAR